MLPEEPPPRYAIGALLGGGESGEVFQARDSQTGEEVAYKLVTARALPTPGALERAQRELKQLVRAQNPRVAKVIDCGKTADGQLFVVTELVAGEPLDRLIERTGAVALDRAKKIVAQIGEALLEGQKVGVVHHDLCPKNVLVNAADEVKVINFVVPRPLSDNIFGVPEYLSPEQAEGRLVDQRSNTYSLGAITMLMLTGSPPFSGETPQAVLQQVLHGEVPAPSHRKADLTPETDRVVMKALDKSSSRRPLTMRQFLNDVASLGTHPSAAATFGAGRPASGGLAKTMMLAGGAPDVQKLVAEARAARAEANGSATTATGYSAAAVVSVPDPMATPPPPVVVAAPDPHRTPPPRSHGAAIAATMIAMPAATPAPIPGQSRGGPVAPAAAAAAAAAHAADEPQARNKGGAEGGNFRETLWFKKGDVDQMVADAKAKAAGGRGKPAAQAEIPHEDAKPLEDRYLDDGSVTVEDRKNFSLRGNSTASSLPAVGGVMPGERMSDTEMLNEMGGGKKIAIIVIAVVAALAVVAVLFVAFRGKGKDSAKAELPATAPIAKAAEEPPAPPAPPKAEPPAPANPPAAAADEDGNHAKEAVAKDTAPARAKAGGKKKSAKRGGKKHH